MIKPTVAVVICSVTLALAGAAIAGGGTTIASARQLPVGENVVGGGACSRTVGCNYREFWRILARPSDRLNVVYGSTDGNSVQLCLLAPSVNDSTIGKAACLRVSETTTRNSLAFTFPTSGHWTLEVSNIAQLAYQLTASVEHYTHASLSAPPVVMHSAVVILAGTVSGVSSGHVELESRSLTHPEWKPLAVATLKVGGKFSYKTKAFAPGTYRIRAVYPGDSSHIASSATVSFKVV